MASKLLFDQQHWLDRAEEVRTNAEYVKDVQAKTCLLKIATEYEELAERARQRKLKSGSKVNG